MHAMLKERWKPIVGFTGYYEVSNMGRVRTVSHFVRKGNGVRYVQGRLRTLQPVDGGYLKVRLYKNDTGHNRWVHRLVARAFLRNPQHKPEVHHRRDPKRNNAVTNLKWVTVAEHARLTRLEGKIRRGSYNGRSELNTRQITEMRELRRHQTLRQLATRYGVGESCVSMIVRRRRWKHII
jgi:hypothetical protein